MHEDIAKYTVQGIVGDEADVVKNKESLIHWLEGCMRDDGNVPLLDADPHYTQEFNAETGMFDFLLTIYGVYIGDEAWDVAGIMGGKTIPRYTQKAKSKQS
jgi:hypothetical protein